MNKWQKIILIILISILIVFIIKKLLPDEKINLIKDIKRLKEAVESEDERMVFNYLDTDYLDQHNLDFEGLKSKIAEFFNVADSINIMISGLKVWIDSLTTNNYVYAHCSLGIRVIARYENERVLVFGGVIQPATVKGYFRKQKNYYKIYWAEY